VLIIVRVQLTNFENIFLVGHCLATILKLVSHLVRHSCLMFTPLKICYEFPYMLKANTYIGTLLTRKNPKMNKTTVGEVWNKHS